ncbi:hypothetical protein [Bacillus sp. MRMR6]|uniref:hypothetical protein n=1 Tax=Bacillus sp. MRMR6 TaxID=1928617 RepID=UPI000951198F|nr:hypothetical protein [Bacillus sp. MRMR6]OLS41853.1 hypothetical protein BTR25_00330 [Bacillus sp. MRMR6]
MTEKNIEQNNQEPRNSQNESLSSFELIWKAGFDELDAWVKRLNDRDEVFLNATRHYVETVKRNQDNVIAITEQFSKELRDWEKGAREELLMSTTTLQHFFPIKSYEEINGVVDDIQKKTMALLATPIRTLTNGQGLDKYLDMVEQYVAFRKNGRAKYVDSVKKTSSVLYENQKIFVNLFATQVKSAMFPFQKYMKNPSEPTKS